MIAELILSAMLAFTPALPAAVDLPVMSDSTQKPYMDYRTVTDTASEQYKLLSSAQHEENGTMTIDGFICVALGQQYGKVGDRFFVTVGGKRYGVIMADAKRYADTAGGAGWTGTNGHVLEMIVDSNYLPPQCRILGDCDPLMPGSVEKVTRWGN